MNLELWKRHSPWQPARNVCHFMYSLLTHTLSIPTRSYRMGNTALCPQVAPKGSDLISSACISKYAFWKDVLNKLWLRKLTPLVDSRQLQFHLAEPWRWTFIILFLFFLSPLFLFSFPFHFLSFSLCLSPYFLLFPCILPPPTPPSLSSSLYSFPILGLFFFLSESSIILSELSHIQKDTCHVFSQLSNHSRWI